MLPSRAHVNSLDLLIIVVCLALAAIGYAQGFIVGAASLTGLVIGGIVGTRVTHALLERGTDNPAASAWAPLIGLAVGVLITIVGAMAMQDLGAQLRGRVQGESMSGLDRLLGALLLGVVGLVLGWFAAAASIGIPQLRELRPTIVESVLVTRLNTVLPDAEPLLGALASYDPFPQFDGGRIETDAPDPLLPRDPEVREASRSVLRVVGSACGYRITGSGWVAAPGFVITNAHVVAGQDDTGVQLVGKGDPIDADVVSFDRINDLAVLRVHGLDLTPLRPSARVAEGTAGVVLGYPENRGFTPTAARYSDERRVKGEDIYGRGEHERRVSSFRGLIRHGNSGGPLVDDDGRVLSTVFAATVGEKVSGGYGIPNDLVAAALKRATTVPADKRVLTGACVA
ncbi:MAG: MarP family serine protease [Thermoleophilia bacterium]|nr:MarP family serine protease [Thermoleophilia bacterium]